MKDLEDQFNAMPTEWHESKDTESSSYKIAELNEVMDNMQWTIESVDVFLKE